MIGDIMKDELLKVCENSSCQKLHRGYSAICSACHDKYTKPYGKSGGRRKVNRDSNGKNIH